MKQSVLFQGLTNELQPFFFTYNICFTDFFGITDFFYWISFLLALDCMEFTLLRFLTMFVVDKKLNVPPK